ncbi:hypothetical protein XENOCAPTIV_016189 [Xenoophorus captivus]|uniref:Uncharacterized protein n=1 Tax=Xenoophorus captivus TaxID=1517983 RepID=A0ABV0RAD3_9TELE
MAGFQSRDFDDVRRGRDFRWRAGSKMSKEATVAESPYCRDLDPVSRRRYKQLIHRYVGCDPYLIKMSEFSREPQDLPLIEAVDITNYLALQTSHYTKQQMKAYKSLEA